ncbi:MAG: RsmD family RNA methyltransferase, partial [Clostridia bacterium]|nr:RsmD family RNA methyltransferase [Clostridia bacterium]
MDWKKVLSLLVEERAAFDLVFLDPPYKLTDLREVTETMVQGRLIHKESLVIVEHDYKQEVAVSPRLALQKQRKYGIVGISIFQLAPE